MPELANFTLKRSEPIALLQGRSSPHVTVALGLPDPAPQRLCRAANHRSKAHRAVAMARSHLIGNLQRTLKDGEGGLTWSSTFGSKGTVVTEVVIAPQGGHSLLSGAEQV